LPASKSKMAVAWAIFHEVISQSAETLVPAMTHPCDEQYECLTAAAYRDDGAQLTPRVSIHLNGTAIQMRGARLEYDEKMIDAQIKKLSAKILAASGLRARGDGPRDLPAMVFILTLLAQYKDIDVMNAWYDGSYSSYLTEQAKAFEHYPVPEEADELKHIRWWLISIHGTPFVLCNLEKNLLIMENGERYDLSAEHQPALNAVRRALLRREFEETIKIAERLLSENTEWEKRYIGYAEDISKNIKYIETVRDSFREWHPFKLYLNVTNTKNAKSNLKLELRYLGQTVAVLSSKKGVLQLDTKGLEQKNAKCFGCEISLSKVPWDGPEAAAFRRFFKGRDKTLSAKGNKGNEEHRLESLLLTEFAKKSDKALPRIQPVKVAKLRFPMPTPLSASNHKQAKYSGQYGGGIDIFARTGQGGPATWLCVIELKDENVQKEPPTDAIKQALTYGVFIRALLRSAAGEAWWKLFGFGGKIPQKLTLYAACAMPSNEDDDESFAGMELELGGGDTAKLHYIYFTEKDNVIAGIKTSLAAGKH